MAVVRADGIRFEWTSPHTPPRDAVVARHLSTVRAHLEEGVVVGHNLRFDFRFVTYEAERLGLDGLDVRFLDTLGLSRRLLHDLDEHRLGALLSALGISMDEPLHTAVGDALATRRLFWRLVEEGGQDTLADIGIKRLRWNGR